MGTINSLTSERAAVVAAIDPANNGAGATNTDEVDHSKFGSTQWTLMTGTMASTSTLDFKLQSASSSGGSFSDITGKAITQLTEAGSDDDKQVVINLRADELTAGDRYVRGVMTIAAAASWSSVVALGFDARYAPASDNDLSSVDEIVN
tara:strand:+ start:977 stop:1423 length:447 start_codon:yes stop_codon:yes gene_type:complete